MNHSRASLIAFFALILTPFANAKIETWTDLDGRSMEAEFVSATDSYVSFRKADGARYMFPVQKLSVADQARVRELTGKSGAAPDASTAKDAPASAPVAKPAGKFTSEISGKLVSLKGTSLSPLPSSANTGTRYYALYYSAQWCPPCRKFTPTLVSAYHEIKARHPEFELIFVSNDQSDDDMKAYMRDYKMPWPAVRHNLAQSLKAVTRYSGRGIPHLVFIDADGAVLSTSYVDGKYLGPSKVLADIKKTLANKS